MPQCQRCGKKTLATIRSLSGNERLCPACSEVERDRPVSRKRGRVKPPDPTVVGVAGAGKDGVNFYR